MKCIPRAFLLFVGLSVPLGVACTGARPGSAAGDQTAVREPEPPFPTPLPPMPAPGMPACWVKGGRGRNGTGCDSLPIATTCGSQGKCCDWHDACIAINCDTQCGDLIYYRTHQSSCDAAFPNCGACQTGVQNCMLGGEVGQSACCDPLRPKTKDEQPECGVAEVCTAVVNGIPFACATQACCDDARRRCDEELATPPPPPGPTPTGTVRPAPIEVW